MPQGVVLASGRLASKTTCEQCRKRKRARNTDHFAGSGKATTIVGGGVDDRTTDIDLIVLISISTSLDNPVAVSTNQFVEMVVDVLLGIARLAFNLAQS
jgi:hypothetical protein